MEKINFAMNSFSQFVFLIIILPLMIAVCSVDTVAAANNNDANIAVVKNYFQNIDNRDARAMSDIFALHARQDFVGHEPIVGVKAIETKLELIFSQLESMETEFIHIFAAKDTVLAHVRHVAVFKAGGALKNRIGISPPVIVLPDSVKVSWQAMAIFQLEGGLIVEETIIRDELAMLQNIGTITLK